MATKRTRIHAAVVATLSLVAGACGLIEPSAQDASAVPPAPPVAKMNNPEPLPAADGLHRFVVTPASDASLSSEAASEATDASPVAGSTPGPSDASARPDNVTLVTRDGVIGYVDDTGVFVPLASGLPEQSVGSSPPAASADPSPPTAPSDAFVEQLYQLSDIVSVTPIGDGSYAVVAETSDALNGVGLDLTVAIDPLLALAADPYEPYQWALDNTGDNLATVQNPAPPQLVDADVDGAEAAAGARGNGVVVAVIDSGVDFSHPDLAGQSWTNTDEVCGNGTDDDGNGFVDDCNGWDFGYEDNVPWSPSNQDHGTHVAGIIAAVAGNDIGTAGLAPGAKIMDLSVDGPGGISTSSVARAIRYAVDNGADVINMSLGTSPGTPAAAVVPMIEAVNYAAAAGVVVVVAAGNSNVNLAQSAVYPASIDAENMIVVGASTANETKASFSNYGSTVTLFAPGQLILSTVPGDSYVFMNGTSQASPIAAAAAAVVIENQPGINPPSVRNQLVGTADEVAAYNGLASSNVRLNSARAAGITDEAGAEVVIRGLASASLDSVVAEIEVSDFDVQIDEPYHWEATLVSISGGAAYGIVDHPVAVDGVEINTDGRGAIPLGPSGPSAATIDTTLPVGSYALLVEAVVTGDPSVRLGDGFVSTFAVAADAPATTTTSTPAQPSTSIQPSTTTTQAPTSTTVAPTTPTSSGPGSSVATSTTSTNSPQPSTSQAPTTSQQPGTTQAPTTQVATTQGPSTTQGSNPSSSAPATTSAPTTAVPAPSTTQNQATTQAPPTTQAQATTQAPTTQAPATTQPPATTGAPTTTTTTTTAAPSPSTTPVVTTPPSTTEGGSDSNPGWSLTRLDPNSGSMAGGTVVSITGTFPELAYVWFGEGVGEVFYQTGSWILVVAPASGAPGPVDVSFRTTTNGTVLTAQNAFTYVDDTPTQTTTTATSGPTPSNQTTTSNPTGSTTTTSSPTSPTSATTSTTSAGGGTPTTEQTSSSTSTTSAVGTSTTSAAATTSTSQGSGNETTSTTQADQSAGAQLEVPRTAAIGDATTLANGLRGVPLGGLSGLGEIPLCASDPCRLRRV